MSTTAPMTLDVSGTPGIPFSRLFQVELRKTVDTRAGRWLVGITAGLALLADVIFLIVVVTKDIATSYGEFVAGAAFLTQALLPILGIMLVTSEWSQRTAMVTFTLEPSRMRVVGAKLVSLVLVSVVALVVGLVLGSLANVLYGSLSGNDLVWGSVGKLVLTYFVAYILSMASGFALGALFLNSPAGIVVYFVYSFVLPGLLLLAGHLMAWFERIRPWIDFNNDQNDLIDGTVHGSGWAHLLTGALLWLLLPLAIGVWRIRGAEVK